MNIWATLQARKRLINAFKHANVYRMAGDSYIFPTIRKVELNDDYTKFTLRLPTGLNPETLTDNLYVFQQIFGPNVVIDGEIKYFTISVYRKGLPKNVPYNLVDWQPIIERMTLPIIVGRDRNNQPQAFDLAIYPHLLLSGETGSGKSSLLRAILTTIMLTKSPDDVSFVLGDLKRSEFSLYRNVKHVDGVHVTPRTLLPALRLIKVEMERRGDLLDKNEVTHIKELRDKLPYIIVAIDEVALLRQEKEIMNIIEDISSIGRSLGVHLILSMQRADSKVMEGRLKNNLSVRISGRQSNKRNASVAGTEGAETIKITDKGRMIYVLDDPIEVQSPWLEYDEAKRLLEPLKVERVDVHSFEEVENRGSRNDFKFGILEELQ